MRLDLLWLTGLTLLAASACQREQAHPEASATTAAASAVSRAQAPLAGEQIEIPPSTFNAGTVPGEHPRDPEIEPRLTQVTLGGYRIDRLPHPNDPALPATTALTREKAEERCAAEGKRLCTELEWELACRGPQSAPFASGAAWKDECGAPEALCPSSFGVLGMGRLREWTASTHPGAKALAAVRGAGSNATPAERRCAHRALLEPSEQANDLGFRCCKGAPNAAEVKVPDLGVPFRFLELPAAKLAEVLATDPATEGLRKISYFADPEASRTVLARGDGNTQGFSFTVKPLIWNPDVGTELVIAVGRAEGEIAFLVALLVVGDNQYRVASSMILRDEPGPVALAYSNDIRPRLHFSSCWGCMGETGKVLYRKPDGVVITQP